MKELLDRIKASFSYMFCVALLTTEGIIFTPQTTAYVLGVILTSLGGFYVLSFMFYGRLSIFLLAWALLSLPLGLLSFASASTTVLAFTTTLVISIIPVIYEEIRKLIKHEMGKHEDLSVLQMIDIKKSEDANKAIILLSLSVLLFVFADFFVYIEDRFLVLSLIAALGMIVLCQRWIENYRIRKGYYGTKEWEAREIIRFIIDNFDDIDFTEDGSKTLFPERHTETPVLLNHTIFSEPAHEDRYRER